MKIKKIPRYLALTLLSTGASLILGFLSFGGTYAIWPILPLAFAAFGLSVAYEGEIYIQNIKGTLDKLFKRNYLKNQLTNEFLLQNIPDTTAPDCPKFFKDYAVQLNLLTKFGHKHLDKISAKQKKQVEKTLYDMEKWFALQLFITPKDKKLQSSVYANDVQTWLARHQQKEWQERLNKQRATFLGVKAFSALAGVFMSLGTTYLLVEAFSVIPALTTISLALWPMFIVPMAIIAGTAYGLLTYNAVTDMIRNDTIHKWINKIRDDFSKGFSIRNLFTATMAVLLTGLALALTICTAGTWWTVAQETRPLFAWMGRMPSFIMGVMNPIITGLSSIVFNLQNSAESLELIDQTSRQEHHFFADAISSIKNGIHALHAHENWLQLLNPFRLLLKVTVMPLRIMLFLGHLVSIGLTADRVPGVSEIVSSLLGIISEGFEDLHYFVGHNHEHEHEHSKAEHAKELVKERLGSNHGHNHDLDLPTRLLKLIFSPIYFMAAGWDYLCSRNNSGTRKVLNFDDAWAKQTDRPQEKTVSLPNDVEQPSTEWQIEQVVYRIERYKEKHLNHAWINSDTALKKSAALTSLQDDLQHLSPTDKGDIALRLQTAKKDPTYNIHRLFSYGKTATTTFIEELPQKTNLVAP